jgi:hypothetical protein
VDNRQVEKAPHKHVLFPSSWTLLLKLCGFWERPRSKVLKMEDNLMVHPFPKEKVVGGAKKMYIHGTFLGFLFYKWRFTKIIIKCSPFQREKEFGQKEYKFSTLLSTNFQRKKG